VFLTGGSAFVPAVRDLRDPLRADKLRGEELSSVAAGSLRGVNGATPLRRALRHELAGLSPAGPARPPMLDRLAVSTCARARRPIAALFAPPSSASLSIAEVLYDAGGADGERAGSSCGIRATLRGSRPGSRLGAQPVSGQQALGVVAARARFLVGGPLGDDAEPPLFDPRSISIRISRTAARRGCRRALRSTGRHRLGGNAALRPGALAEHDSALLDPTGAPRRGRRRCAERREHGTGLDGIWRVQPSRFRRPAATAPEPSGLDGTLAAATAGGLRSPVGAELQALESRREP
jgi:hypothetical protein